jgi:hypothetical protein
MMSPWRDPDTPKTDQRDIPQLVVLLKRSSASDFRWRGRWQCVIGWRDVDLADDARPILLPADVNHRGRQQNCGERHPIDPAPRVHGSQSVGNQQNDEHADQRLDYRPLSASQSDATKNGSRQHDHFKANADVAAHSAQARSKEQGTDAGQHAARDIAQRDRSPHRDAGVVGRSARTTDGHDVPSGPQPGHENMAEHCNCQVNQRNTGNSEYGAVPDEVPGRDVRKRRSDIVRIALDQEIESRAVDDQRDQRRADPRPPMLQRSLPERASPARPADKARRNL